MHKFERVDTSDSSEEEEQADLSSDNSDDDESSESREMIGSDEDEVQAHLETLQYAQYNTKKRKAPKDIQESNKKRKVQMFSAKTESNNPFQIHDEKAKLKSQLEGNNLISTPITN